MARNSIFKALMVTMAENSEATAQRCRLYTTVLSMIVVSLRNFELYLVKERCY